MTDPSGSDEDDVVMQSRCVFCGREHYMFNVMAISLGQAPCACCGRVAAVYYDKADYFDDLRLAEARRAEEP